MTADVQTVEEETPLEDVVRVIEHNRIKRVPVLHKKKLIGIITRANLLRALVGAAELRQALGR